MRFLNKYKLHENYASADWKLPRRVIKFKRPKWIKIKSKLRRAKRFEWVNNRKLWIIPTYIDHIKIGVASKIFIKKFFKIKQQTKKYLASLFESGIKFQKKQKKKVKNRKIVVLTHVVKPLFRVDILLWYLHFFKSSVQAKNFIDGKNVLINEKLFIPNYKLKKGDIISFDLNFDYTEDNPYRKMLKRYKKSRQFFPFLEYDYYTNRIIILKDWNQLSRDELSLTVKITKKFKYV